MILNLAATFEIPIPHKKVQDVRASVNERRALRSQPLLAADGWFTNADIGEYIRENFHLNEKQYPCIPEDKDETLANIQRDIDQGFTGLFFTNGRHFRAVVAKDDAYLLLDSFANAPSPIGEDQIEKMIVDSFVSHSDGRAEIVGIIR
jgi:hypothetical protein